MFRMRRLKAGDIDPEGGVMKPLGHEPPETTLSFRSVEVLCAMKGMTGERRVTLARDDEHRPSTLQLCIPEETQKVDTREFYAGAVEIQTAFDIDMAAGEALCGAAIKARELWWQITVMPRSWSVGLRRFRHRWRGYGRFCGSRMRSVRHCRPMAPRPPARICR